MQERRRDSVEPWFSMGLFVVAALLLGWGIAGGSLWNGDDSTYALMAREIREHGDFLHLRLDGAVLHQRPPLYPWLLVVSTTIFGETEFALRLPAVLMGAGVSVVIWRLGRLVLPRSISGCAALLFSTLSLPAIYARSVTSDTTLVFFTLLSIHLYVRARRREGSEEGRGGSLLPFGLALGAALMTKQIVGFLPLIAPAVEISLRGRKGIPSWRQIGRAAGGALLVAAPWHVALLIMDGSKFVDGYFGYNVVQRASSSVLYETPRTFYFSVLWKKEGPMILIALVGLVLMAVRARQNRRVLEALLVIWPVAVIGAFSLASTRLDYYLLPAYPAIALLMCAPFDLIPARGLALALGGILVIGSAGAHLPSRIESLDYSGELRHMAEAAKAAGGPDDPLFVIDDLPMAPRFYSRLPTFTLVTRKSNYDRMMTMELFREPGRVLHVTATRIPDFLATQPRWFALEKTETAQEHPPPAGARLLATTDRYILYTNVPSPAAPQPAP
jgi:4-amino-4-deoxy-L-arabinose transferase-like glycosyltransferase